MENTNNVSSCVLMETVVIDCVASTSKYYLKNLSQLRGKKILAVEAPKVADIAKEPKQGRALVNATIYGLSFLTLTEKEFGETISEIPLGVFNRGDNQGRLVQFGNGKDFNLDKSYIDIANISSLSASESFMLIFYYLDPERDNA